MKKLAPVLITLLFFAVPSISFAAGLTNPQVQAILSLLAAFGADSATIASVEVALISGTSTGVPSGSISAKPSVGPINYSASALAAGLTPQLAYITCNWYNNYGDVLFSKTSDGLLGPETSNGTYFINTVLGGVLDTSYTGSPLYPSSCNISFPGGSSLYAGGYSIMTAGLYNGTSPVSIPNINIDYAQVAINASNPYLVDYASKNNYCSSRASVSDPIAVIGYSSSNAANVTTWTGRITGTSGYFDMADVAVPDNMQGATVVSLARGCIIGQMNSSGDIADMEALRYLYGW